MKKRLLILNLIVVFLIVSPLSVYAATATDAVQGGVDKILTKLRDPAFKSLAREEKIAGIREIINGIFDWTELSKRTLGRNWKKFSDAQKEDNTIRFFDIEGKSILEIPDCPAMRASESCLAAMELTDLVQQS